MTVEIPVRWRQLPRHTCRGEKKQKNEQLSIFYTVPEVSVLICGDIRVPLEHIVSRVVTKGAGGYVPVSATPLRPTRIKFCVQRWVT